MIRISQIDNNFSIYKNNIVVLIGIGEGTKSILDLMRYHKININFICDSDPINFGKNFEGIQIIQPRQLQELSAKNNNKVLVQIGALNTSNDITEQLNKIGIKNIVSYNEAHKILYLMNFIKLYKFDNSNPILNYCEPHKPEKVKNDIQNFLNLNGDLPIFVCQLPKTGDGSVTSTFKENNIPFYFTNHTPHFFNKEQLKDKKVKITAAIREPIAQNISMLYQMISETEHYQNSLNIIKNDDNFFKDGGDAQVWFDYIFSSNFINVYSFNIPAFMNSFKNKILDISKYPFDKEKGYTIIKQDNVEVFVYKLEKMNNIAKDLSDWVGINPFDKWVINNEASTKWIANSYKQAQKELKFPKEYFDSCYDNDWIRHFYSDDEIKRSKKNGKIT